MKKPNWFIISHPKEWVEYASWYTDRGAWSNQHGVGGFEGFIRFHEQRQQIELDLLPWLEIPCQVIDAGEEDWQAAVDFLDRCYSAGKGRIPD